MVQFLGSTIEYGISTDEIVKAVEQETAGKPFTAERKKDTLTLSWIEEGIKEWATDITMIYSKENSQVLGKVMWKNEYYQKSRMVQRIVYLDGKERVLKDVGPEEPVKVSKEVFEKAVEQVKAMQAAKAPTLSEPKSE